jgi:predicted transcriptional regulator YdeE
MKATRIEPFAVNGPSVRTTNAREAGDSGKIPSFWARFHASRSTPAETAYGVYSAYESDASGDFTVTAGTKSMDGSGVPVKPGTYLAFPAEGAMPAAIINAWKSVWESFSKTPFSIL